jgi:hypothetical protein
MIRYHGRLVGLLKLSRATGIPKPTLEYRYAQGVRGEALWSPERKASEGASAMPSNDLKLIAQEERQLKAQQAAKEKKRAKRRAVERAKCERLKAEIRYLSSLVVS